MVDVKNVVDGRVAKIAWVWDVKKLHMVGFIQADPDPLDLDNWIKPLNSSFDEPPVIEENQAVVRDVENDEWIVETDFRGTEYWDEDGTKHTITELGEEVPEGALLEEPPEPDPTDEELASAARLKRDSLISEMSWRYERHASEIRLGIETTDSIELLDQYAQALRDITEQEGFPSVIEWPEAP